MTDPKVGEKEMLDYLQKNCPCPCQAYPDGKCKIAIEEQCYETHRAIRAAIEERGRLRDEVGQLRVQLAGCMTAAEGGIYHPVLANQGDYGWSAAYASVVNLRRKFEAAIEERGRLNKVNKDFIKKWANNFPAILTTKRAIELITAMFQEIGIGGDLKLDGEEK